MLFNWMLEATKWKLLMDKHEHISFSDSAKAVVSGIVMSIITPNQIGDFVGRVIYLKNYDKLKASLVAVIGHTAQVILALGFGLFAFIFLIYAHQKVDAQTAFIANSISVLSVVIAVLGFLNIHLVSKFSKSEKIIPYLEVFAFYSKVELLKVFILSFLRYSIFVIQYVLLLHFFGVEISVPIAVCCVVATLCAQTFVPSFLLVELGMRGASALFFFSFYTNNSVGILLSSYSLWMINLMLPSLFGLMAITAHKFKK